MSKPVLTIELRGQEALKRDFAKMSANKKAEAVYLIHRTSLEIMNDAKTACRTDMGLLRASIRPTFYQSGLTAYIGSDVKYAAFVEYGTGPLGASTNRQHLPDGYVHGSSGKMPPLILIREWCKRVGIDEKLAFVIARSIGRHGLKARPYLGPALEKHRAEFLAYLRKIINREPLS